MRQEMQVEWVSIDLIKPYAKNPRRNDASVPATAESIKQFGWQQPIVVDKDGVIIAGHTRYKAAKKLEFDTVPVVYARDLTDEQVRHTGWRTIRPASFRYGTTNCWA